MSKTDIHTMMERVKAATALDSALLSDAAKVVRRVFPAMPAPSAQGSELIEQVLHMIDQALPFWSINLTGKATEPDGHWRCSLRETRGSDDIELVGLGSGPVVALALLEALLSVAEQLDAR